MDIYVFGALFTIGFLAKIKEDDGKPIGFLGCLFLVLIWPITIGHALGSKFSNTATEANTPEPTPPDTE